MGSFLLIVVAALVLSGIVFGAAAFTLGRDRGLTPPRPDGVPFDLPADRPLERSDIADLRIDTAIRGYRMEQVDEILLRVADDFDFLHARIIDLEDQLHGRRADDDEDEDRPFEFPWNDDKTEDADATVADEKPAEAPADAPAVSTDEAPDAKADSAEEEPEVAGPRSGRGR